MESQNEQHTFVLNPEGKIVVLPEVPEEPEIKISQLDANCHPEYAEETIYLWDLYNKALQSAIASGIEVENQEEVKEEIENSLYQGCTASVNLEENKLYPLQCRVDFLTVPHGTGKVARVTFEQPEAAGQEQDFNSIPKVTSALPKLIGTVHYKTVFMEVSNGLDSSIYEFELISNEDLLDVVTGICKSRTVKSVHLTM